MIDPLNVPLLLATANAPARGKAATLVGDFGAFLADGQPHDTPDSASDEPPLEVPPQTSDQPQPPMAATEALDTVLGSTGFHGISPADGFPPAARYAGQGATNAISPTEFVAEVAVAPESGTLAVDVVSPGGTEVSPGDATPAPSPDALPPPTPQLVPAHLTPSPRAQPMATAAPGEALLAGRTTGHGATGEFELLATPWQLQAHSGLSYRHVASANPTLPTPECALPPISATSAPSMIPLAKDLPPRERALEFPRETSFRPVREGGPAKPIDPEIDHCGTDVGAWYHHGLFPLMLWPQRLLRWLGDADAGGFTAWVRDFSLAPEKVQPLIDSLRCLADQQGVPLRRIMLNGHELWRSPSNP